MVPNSIHRDRLPISSARRKQLSTGVACFQMGPSLQLGPEFSLS